MENAAKQFKILNDLAKRLKGGKTKTRPSDIEVRPLENDTLNDISPIAPMEEEHKAYSPESRLPQMVSAL